LPVPLQRAAQSGSPLRDGRLRPNSLLQGPLPQALPASRQASRRCAVVGCAGRFYARGLCLRHYREQIDAGLCAVDGCAELAGPTGARGYCSLHYKRLRTRGAIGGAERERGPHLSTLPGRCWLDPQGYRRVKVNGAIRGEHQLVMGDHRSRRLRAYETVHHRNGVRHDNRLSNLEFWAKPHPPGQRVADVVAWVVREYPQEVRALLGRCEHAIARASA